MRVCVQKSEGADKTEEVGEVRREEEFMTEGGGGREVCCYT